MREEQCQVLVQAAEQLSVGNGSRWSKRWHRSRGPSCSWGKLFLPPCSFSIPLFGCAGLILIFPFTSKMLCCCFRSGWMERGFLRKISCFQKKMLFSMEELLTTEPPSAQGLDALGTWFAEWAVWSRSISAAQVRTGLPIVAAFRMKSF